MRRLHDVPADVRAVGGHYARGDDHTVRQHVLGVMVVITNEATRHLQETVSPPKGATARITTCTRALYLMPLAPFRALDRIYGHGSRFSFR